LRHPLDWHPVGYLAKFKEWQTVKNLEANSRMAPSWISCGIHKNGRKQRILRHPLDWHPVGYLAESTRMAESKES
jgi:hypothetical protein